MAARPRPAEGPVMGIVLFTKERLGGRASLGWKYGISEVMGTNVRI